MSLTAQLWLTFLVIPLLPFLTFYAIQWAILVICEVQNLRRCHRRVTLAAILHNLMDKG